MKPENKKMLYIGGAILALLTFIGIFIYRSGKKSGTTVVDQSTAVTDNPTNPTNNNIPAMSESELKTLVAQATANLEGYNPLGHDTEFWKNILILSDTDFVRFYNEYNIENQVKTGNSFTTSLQGEWYEPFGDWENQKSVMLTRLNKLNLK